LIYIALRFSYKSMNVSQMFNGEISTLNFVLYFLRGKMVETYDGFF
jgi:hypothetical protein